jgi:hypothetical protein
MNFISRDFHIIADLEFVNLVYNLLFLDLLKEKDPLFSKILCLVIVSCHIDKIIILLLLLVKIHLANFILL